MPSTGWKQQIHGAWPHWLDGHMNKTIPFSPNDDGGNLVEMSFLVQGMLCMCQHFKDGKSVEQALATKMIDKLWWEMEWDWYQGPDKENMLFSQLTHMGLEQVPGYLCVGGLLVHARRACHWAQGGKGYNVSSKLLFWSHYSFLGLDQVA
jgi:hypothetical protein